MDNLTFKVNLNNQQIINGSSGLRGKAAQKGGKGRQMKKIVAREMENFPYENIHIIAH